MSSQKNKRACPGLAVKLRDLFSEKGTSRWAREIGVSYQTVHDNWYEGACPTADNIIKICEASNVSANWLLLDIGEKYLSEAEPEQVRPGVEVELADLETITWYRSKIDRLEAKIDKLESVIEQGQKAVESTDTIASPPQVRKKGGV